MKNKKKLISILITNFNKEKFIKKSLQSIIKQNYSNYEIIIFDDCSTDNSIKIIKNFKKVKIIENKNKRYTSSPLNQINGILSAFKISKGKLICLLDADDLFQTNKLSEILKYFKINKNENFVVNFPDKKSNFELKRINSEHNHWPTIFPTSCISFRRDFFIRFIRFIEKKKFENLEIDARLIIYSYYNNSFKIINKRLTKYVKDELGISSNYKKFSINWWIKRKEAFDYLNFILKKKKIIFVKSLDYYTTNFVYFFLNLFK